MSTTLAAGILSFTGLLGLPVNLFTVVQEELNEMTYGPQSPSFPENLHLQDAKAKVTSIKVSLLPFILLPSVP